MQYVHKCPATPKKGSSSTSKLLKSRKCHRQEPAKNKNKKVSILAKKMNEKMSKTIAKNRTSREFHIQSQNVKKYVTIKCVQHTPKHCVKCQSLTSKKMHH